jgi:hypothetical protein
MTPHLVPPSSQLTPLSPMQTEGTINVPLRVWSQLDPPNRQQLAQHLAKLIRRIRLQSSQLEEINDDQP